jgi:hypothetical protein
MIAVKLVQPGLLQDVTEGVQRVAPENLRASVKSDAVRDQLERLRNIGFIELYAGRRYTLTERGNVYITTSGIKYKMDARRLFLLRETRRNMVSGRSGARDGSLKQ